MTSEYDQAGQAAKRLTEAGFPAVRASAAYPAYGGGGDEGIDNDSTIVWMKAGDATALVFLMSVLSQGAPGGKRKSAWPPPEGISDEVLRDILLLACRDVPPSVIAQWSPQEKALACQWASLTHLSASDNPVRLVDEPWFVKVAAQVGVTEQGSAWEEWLVSLLDDPDLADERLMKTLNLAREMFGGLKAQVAAARAAASWAGRRPS